MSQIPATLTEKNLEGAFAGESMAFMKYSYFAKLARAMGDEATAAAFEETAKQEIQHAFGHLDLLYPADSLNPAKMLEIAIVGETYEYTEMYPKFKETALADMKKEVVELCKTFVGGPSEQAMRDIVKKYASNGNPNAIADVVQLKDLQVELTDLQNQTVAVN